MSARVIGRTGKVRGFDEAVTELLTVGSGRQNALRIDSRTVSRQHAQIVKSGSEYFVEDLESRNGTFLNGQRVKRFPIRHLDVLSIGPEADLIFLERGTAAPVVQRRAALTATVQWLDGRLAGTTETVTAGSGLLLGRRAELESLVALSRRHAILTIRDDRVTIEDLGSANGTWVNGKPITAVKPLADGDEVSLANLVRLRVSIVSADAARVQEPAATDEPDPETVVVTDTKSRRGPVLDRRRSTGSVSASMSASAPGGASAGSPAASPQPTSPEAVVADQRQTQVQPAPPAPAAPVEKPVEEPRTMAAPREAAVAPVIPVSGSTPAPPVPSVEPPPGDGTMSAPREGVAAPLFRNPFAPRELGGGEAAADRAEAPSGAKADAEPMTFAQPRDSAGAVPLGVLNQAQAAKNAVSETRTTDPLPRPKRPEPEPVELPPTVVSTTSGAITGVRLDGTQDLELNRGTFVVGRHPSCDIHLDARDVGRNHAKLHVREDRVTVEDLGSANGTFVNDKAVTGEVDVPDGGHLRFATVAFTVTYFRTEGQTS